MQDPLDPFARKTPAAKADNKPEKKGVKLLELNDLPPPPPTELEGLVDPRKANKLNARVEG